MLTSYKNYLGTMAIAMICVMVDSGAITAQFNVKPPKPPKIHNPVDKARELAERLRREAKEAADKAAADAKKEAERVAAQVQAAADKAAADAKKKADKAVADAIAAADKAEADAKRIADQAELVLDLGKAQAVEFDKSRRAALKEVEDRAKRDGIELSDDAKKAGAIVSNTWKMYNGKIDGLPGWLREHAEVGDIIAAGNIWNLDIGEWGHIAIVTDPKKELLFESTKEAGVHEIEWEKFAKEYVKIALYRVKGVDADEAAKVVAWVKEQNGKPYCVPIIDKCEKDNTTRMYCSQLVWNAYKRVLDIDLHGSKSPIIHPDEMLRNRNMELQAHGRKW